MRVFDRLGDEARVWALTALTAVVASGVGLAIALVGGDGGDELAIATPPPTRTTVVPTPTAATPTPTATPTATPAVTQTPSPTATPAPTVPPTQAASSVDCDDTATFCSAQTGRMTVQDGKISSHGSVNHSTDYSNVPTSTMTWQFLESDGSTAEAGDEITRLRVAVVVENKTSNRTFVFPRREVFLEVKRNGNALDPISTTGAQVELPPGGKIDSSFEVPIDEDGSYEWRSKTWFYEKR